MHVIGDAEAPALANDLAYSSVSSERQTPAADPPPNGPLPMLENICWNMVLRNTASKSFAAFFALLASLPLAAAFVVADSAALVAAPSGGADRPGAESAAITSPRCRPGSRRLL